MRFTESLQRSDELSKNMVCMDCMVNVYRSLPPSLMGVAKLRAVFLDSNIYST